MPAAKRIFISAYRTSLVLALVACVVVGHWNRSPALPTHLLNVDEAFNAAGQSASLAKVLDSGAPRPMMMIDSQNDQFFEVFVGEDLGTYVRRWETLRVDRQSGKMWRLSYDAGGEATWLPESLASPRRTS